MEIEIPKLSTDFLCIANMNEIALTAVVCSYIGKQESYLPLFEFPSVSADDGATDERNLDPHHMSRSRAQAFNIKIQNTINRLRTCNDVILVGLSDDQKSYLTFLDSYNIIDIQNFEEAEILLGMFTQNSLYLTCGEDDVLQGLYCALNKNMLLRIDQGAETIKSETRESGGLVVIENIDRVASVLAVNYAIASGCEIAIISPPTVNHREITYLIEAWQEGDIVSYNDLSAALYADIQDIEFSAYNYAVFFTQGAPYSLILGNIIPFCHVHYRFNVDFFVFNAIYFEMREKVPSAIVFSPQEFDDEETLYVVKKGEEANFYVRKLIGDTATSGNLDNHVQHYPYELLHICSHGGEVEGVTIVEEFDDQDGNRHIVEYDQVLSLAIEEGEEKIKVSTKMLFRWFDGLKWMSRELSEKNYPNYVYTDMMNAIRGTKDKVKGKRKIILDSSAIKCSDFNYQAMFNFIAAGHSPIVFNNTCWSWSDIADSFLGVGARTYIGTLWKVQNDLAARTGERFYDKVFNGTVLSAFHHALDITKGTTNENIYILWGLPFVSLKPGVTIKDSKKEVLSQIMISWGRWSEKYQVTHNEYQKETILVILRWLDRQVRKYFVGELREDVERHLWEKKNK